MKLTRRDFFKATLTVPVGLALPCAVKAKGNTLKTPETDVQFSDAELVKAIKFRAKIADKCAEFYGRDLVPERIIVNRVGWDLLRSVPIDCRRFFCIRLLYNGGSEPEMKLGDLPVMIGGAFRITDKPMAVVKPINPYHEPVIVFGYMEWNENL